MFPPGKNPGMPATGAATTGPLPFPTCCPWLPMRPCRLPPFQRQRSLGGRARWKQLPSGKQRGGGWEGPQRRGARREEENAALPSREGWTLGMGRPRCGVQGSTQSSRLGIKRVCGLPLSSRHCGFEQAPVTPLSLLLGHRTGEMSSGSSGELSRKVQGLETGLDVSPSSAAAELCDLGQVVQSP